MAHDLNKFYRVLFRTAYSVLLRERFANILGEVSGEVLVVGAGYNPYADYISTGAKVTTLDIDPECEPHFVGDVHDLPFTDKSYDFVVAFDVIEHLSDPTQAVAEVQRVLRDGGSVPFLFRVHGDPFDYSRFTNSGLQQFF